jgi:hypothetical protein
VKVSQLTLRVNKFLCSLKGSFILVKRGGLLQLNLAVFCLLTGAIIVFFLGLVLFRILYVLATSQTVHFMGTKKTKVEFYAFILSSFSLIFMGVPSIHLLYKFSAETEFGLIVKVSASQ